MDTTRFDWCVALDLGYYTGSLIYERRGHKEKVVESEPHQSAVLKLDAVSLQLSDAQLHSAGILAEVTI